MVVLVFIFEGLKGGYLLQNATQFLRVYIMINKLLIITATLGVCAFTALGFQFGHNIVMEGYVAIAPVGIIFLSGIIVGLLTSLLIREVLDYD